MASLFLVRGPRRYRLDLEVDLFDAVVLTRCWSGENNLRHGRRQELLTDLDAGQARFDAVRRYLIRSGYVTDPQGPPTGGLA